MRAVLTRVKEASVRVEGELVSEIGQGFLVLLGVSKDDGEAELRYIADRISGIRIFSDSEGKMNLAPKAVNAEILLVSQFTLYADISKRRPGFTAAAGGEMAERLYEELASALRAEGFTVKTGVFGAMMEVCSINDYPVTIIIDSENR